MFAPPLAKHEGVIFGDERSPQWTQCIYGKKSRFQNPLRQNFRHVKAIADFLGVTNEVLRSVVFFIGDCDFKTPMPPNLLSCGLCSYIQSFCRWVFSPEEAGDIFTRLTRAKAAPAANHALHVSELRERHGGNTCPKCGSALVMKTARNGPNAGGLLFCCSGFPKCRYTRSQNDI
jgi:restriction system protein